MDEKNLKQMLTERGLSEQHAETLISFGKQADSLKETCREFGAFRAMVDEDRNIVISSVSGWKLVYPPMTNAWVYLLAWMVSWDDCRVLMEAFVKAMVFPVANRIENIDEQYVTDLVNAQAGIDKRNADAGLADAEQDPEAESRVLEAFGKVLPD